MHKVLVVSYSQSGQLNEVVNQFLLPFEPTVIERLYVVPKKAFPFPWTTDTFFDTMPETVLEHKIELEPIHTKSDQYDLIVLAYQPWFLSPSLPISSLLQTPVFQKLMAGTPVVTLVAGRNMWLNSQERIKKYIKEAGGILVGNIPFVDKTANLVSVITILHWMLTGQKTRKWGLFPLPGVSKRDIEGASKFGELTRTALLNNQFDSLQKNIINTGEIDIPTDILFIEERAKKLFYIWANLISKNSANQAKRNGLVTLFKYYLLIALFIVSPILLTVYHVLIAPFTKGIIRRKKEYFYGLELKE
jgi:hypothetical protein